MEQLHKRFTDNDVKELLRRYVKKEIKREYIQPGILHLTSKNKNVVPKHSPYA